LPNFYSSESGHDLIFRRLCRSYAPGSRIPIQTITRKSHGSCVTCVVHSTCRSRSRPMTCVLSSGTLTPPSRCTPT
jgi:hypothetical protein